MTITKNKKIKNKNLKSYAEEVVRLHGGYTLKERAIPSFKDGLKPVLRRVLWSMYTLGIKSSGGYKKSARIVGDTGGKYHPHGDSSIYDAMVNATQTAYPLIDGQGNWGDYESPPSAMRYTECRLSKLAENILLDPKYIEIVPFKSNYDGEEKEPQFLPAKLPTFLLTGSYGIATASRVDIPSFSLSSVIEVVKEGLENPLTVEYLFDTLKLKFKYGGELYSEKDSLSLKNFISSGNGNIKLIPKIKTNVDILKITSMSPNLKSDKILNMIGKIPEIKTIEDLREGNEIKFEIKLKQKWNTKKRNEVVDKIKKELSKSSFIPCSLKVILPSEDDDEELLFKPMSLVEYLNEWIEFRKYLDKKVFENEIIKKQNEINKLKLKVLAAKNITTLATIIKNSKNPKKETSEKLKITLDEASYILSLSLLSISKMEIRKIKEKIENKKEAIKTFKLRITNPSSFIKKELDNLLEEVA